MEPKLEELRKFIIQEDRSVPPHYAGREDVLANIEDICSMLWSEHGAGESRSRGMTRVIFGAPGAGKSSTLYHLERTWLDGKWCSSRTGPPPLMLYLGDPSTFADPAMLTERLDGLLSEHTGSVLTGVARKGRELRRRLLAFQTPLGGVSIGEAGREGSDDPLARALKRHSPVGWSRPLVMAIDEFQTISGDVHSLHSEWLRSLHQVEYGAPILLLLAGLGDTVARASELGISRLAQGAAHSLGCFEPEESADLIAGWGRHFGLRDGSWQGVMRELAVECDHWPVHVQNALSALAEEIVVHEGDMSRLDLAAVRRRSGELQRYYYASRMSPAMRSSKLLLAAVMTDLRPGMDSGEIQDSINEHVGSGPGVRWQLPKSMDARAYFNHLVHRGALQEDAFGTVSCPIPSFRRYMVALGDYEPPRFCG